MCSCYKIGNSILERVNLVRNLGVTLSEDLNFTEHINQICSKAIRNLGFLKRNCSEFNNPNYLITLYFSLVRSILEFGLVV
jgi:hypothetical protein